MTCSRHHSVTFRNAPALRLIAALLAFSVCFCVISAAPALAQSAQAPLRIVLSDDGISADYPGVYAEGSTLTITLPGEYLLEGALSNGRIIVDCEQTGKVRLCFAGVSIHCEDGPALHIKKCSPRLTIELKADTVNNLSDGAVYANQDKVDAVIYSKSDLTITGEGPLNISGAYRDGIVSKDDLRIKGGKINVEAVHNGICGKDCVEIFDGEISVIAGNDGIKTTNEDAGLGYISMEGGTVTVLCGDDPLSFVHGFFQIGGTINTRTDPSMKKK